MVALNAYVAARDKALADLLAVETERNELTVKLAEAKASIIALLHIIDGSRDS